MSEPFILHKDGDTLTVYGRNQAAVYAADGWQPIDDSIALPVVTLQTGEVDATNAAAKLADESGIDLATVKGTGANGRITLGDVKAALDDN